MTRGAMWMPGLLLVMLTALAPVLPAAVGLGIIGPAAAAEARVISPDRAAEIARGATGGRVLSVERRGEERPWYRVKVLVDGERVRYVAVDAVTGRIRE